MSIFKTIAKVATKYAPIVAVVLAAAKDVKAELRKPGEK
jgi:hypothetical protein